MKRLKDKEVRGVICLYKNDRMIRDQKFFKRYDMKKYMKKFKEICDHSKPNYYYITILLDM